jgi:GH15 family glucan-1,4-alpha-glucosidase
MTTISSSPVSALLATSLDIISLHQQPNGAYAASPEFSAYRGYCWFRDGAFIADGASSAGEIESASAFFGWCAATIERYAGTIEMIVDAAAEGTPVATEHMLPARFTMDGHLGGDDWWDFQLDGYGTWLWAAVQHANRHDLDLTEWRRAAELTVDYLLSSWARPCYDWWEEHQEQVHVSTLGCVGAGLQAAIDSGLADGDRAVAASNVITEIRALIDDRGISDGHLVKWLDSSDVDGSLAAIIAPMGFIPPDSALAISTIAALDDQLSFNGGVHRYLADVFYGGGQWPLLSCFLGLAKAAVGDGAGARALLEWAASTATSDGMLPEQVDRHLLFPEHRDEWITRWGTVATPLLWSHAMLLRLAAEMGEQ